MLWAVLPVLLKCYENLSISAKEFSIFTGRSQDIRSHQQIHPSNDTSRDSHARNNKPGIRLVAMHAILRVGEEDSGRRDLQSCECEEGEVAEEAPQGCAVGEEEVEDRGREEGVVDQGD